MRTSASATDAESAPVLGQSDVISYGSANMVGSAGKDEDRVDTLLSDSDAPSAFGVFDGHSGAEAAPC